MNSIVYFLLFLWSIVQAVAFWFPMVSIIGSFQNAQSGDAFLFILLFIVVNLVIGFISIFILGQFHRDETEHHFLFKAIVNGLCGSIRLPMHVLIRIILLFNDVPIFWGW